MSERKYKVGDVVRTLVDTDMEGNKLFPKGTIGIITRTARCSKDSKYQYKVDANEDWWYYSADMIESVDEDGIPKREMTREETIERLKSIKSFVSKYDDVVALREAIKAIEKESKTGYWILVDPQRLIHRCSECGTEGYVNTCNHVPTWNYCPICGIKMEEQYEGTT